MRMLVAGIVLASLVAGCSKSDDAARSADDSLTLIAAQNAPSDNEADKDFDVGDPAPKFKDLVGTDDERHSLKDFADAKAVVVVFTCNSCPVAVAYEDRLVAFHNDYADQGVQLVAINVNNIEADKLPAMKKRADEKGFEFPYLYDPTQKVAREYGATVTPHFYLLDPQRRLAYVGPMDDSQNPDKIEQQYLRDAVEAVLAGSMPEATNVKPFGCGIKYE